MEFKIFSKALYSTWILYRPERVLFDAGEGISTVLGNSVYAIKEVFITHGHVDHIAGLWGLINTRNNAMGDREKALKINYPKKNRAIEDFLRFITEMNPKLRYEMILNPIEPGEEVYLRTAGNFRRSVIPFPVQHTSGEISYGYHVLEERRKLKPEFSHLSPQEISDLVKEKGRDFVTQTYKKKILTVSGDCNALPVSVIKGSETLIHECTFINGGDRRGQNHAVLSEILDNVREASDIKRLILYHISSRYSSKISVLRKKLQEEFAEKGIKIYLVHPERLFVL